MRSTGGRREPMIASTATANAISVAVGIAPPLLQLRVRPHDQDVQQRRDRDTTRSGGDRDDRGADVSEVTGNELAFEFEPDEEEEDRQQPVCGPRA